MASYRCLPQYLSAIAVSLGACVGGGWMIFTSVAIPKMMNISMDGNSSEGFDHSSYYEEDPISIDLHQGSWIASLFFIGNIMGCLAGGVVNQRFGSRKVFLFSAPFSTLTWVMLALSQDLWMIFVSRIISGFIFGLYQANGKVYNAEIAHPDLRGSLGTVISNMFALGSIYTYITGYFIHSWRIIAWLQLIPSGLMGISCFFIPDSPFWLVEKGRYQEAKESLIILRGSHYDVNDEFQEIVNKKKQKEAKGRTVFQTLCSKVFLLPFLRIGSLMIITQWAGINVITAYMVNIFIQSGSSIDPSLAPILVCTVQQCLATCSTAVLRVSPRKPLFLICASAIAVSQAGLGTYSYFSQDTDEEFSNKYGWIPLACVLCVNAFKTVGFLVVIQLTLAESFPTEIRAYAFGICGAFKAVNMFGATKLYPYFVDWMGFHGTFWMYGCVMVVEVLYGWISLPENKGQSLVKTEDKMINEEEVAKFIGDDKRRDQKRSIQQFSVSSS